MSTKRLTKIFISLNNKVVRFHACVITPQWQQQSQFSHSSLDGSGGKNDDHVVGDRGLTNRGEKCRNSTQYSVELPPVLLFGPRASSMV